MPMSRKTRIWLILLSIPILIIVAGVITLEAMFTSDRLKSIVIPRAEAATGRSVGIDDISLSVFPSIALRMEGVTLANKKGEGFSSTPLLALEALRLNVKLFPLLKSRLEVTSLEIDRPRLLLEVNGRNETNYSNLVQGGGSAPGTPGAGASSAGPAPGTPGAGASPAGPAPAGTGTSSGPVTPGAPPASVPAMALLVENVLVNGGSVDYVNLKDNSATRVRNLSLSMDLSSAGDRITITGDAATDSLSYGTVESPLLEGLRVRLQTRMSYDLPKDVLEFETGDMTFQDMRLTLKGSVSHIRSSTVMDLSLGTDSLNIADLLSLVPKAYAAKTEGIKGKGTARVNIAITGTLTDTTSADVSGAVAVTEGSIQYPGLPKPITGITLLSRFTRTKSRQEFRIEDMKASLGGAPFSLAMTVVNFDNPHLTLSAAGSLDLATVRDFYPLEKGTDLGGGMSIDVRLDGYPMDPKSLRASGSMTFRDVSAKTAGTAKPVRKLNGTITFNNELAESQKLSLLIGESDLTLSCRVKNYLSIVNSAKGAPRATATMTLQSNHMLTADIMSAPPAPAGGSTKGESSPAAAGSGEQKPVKSPAPPQPGAVKGKAAFPLPDVDIDANAAIGTLTLEKFEFTNIRGAVHVSRGVVTMQNLSLGAFGGTVVSTGSLDLGKPERPTFDLSLNLNGVDAAPLLSHFTSFGQRLSGALTTSTKLKGALNDTLGLVPEALEGNGKVGVKNGALKGFKVNQSLASQLKLPDLETIQFKDWGNDFTVEKGRLTVKDLTITASTGQYVVNGSQGLDGSLDYHMALYLPPGAGPKLNIPGFAGEAVNLFKDQSGRFKLDFNIGGTTDNPKVQLDTDPAKKRAEEMAKQKLDAEKKKLGEQLKNKASDALKKLFKK